MYFSDAVQLGYMKPNGETVAGGYPGNKIFVAQKTVYADLRSVRREEFYKAAAAGKAVAAVFVVHSEDYRGEEAVKFKGRLYNVVRSFMKESTVELNCSVLSIEVEDRLSVDNVPGEGG